MFILDKIRFEKSVLNNGIRVVSERHHYSNSVSVGIWVATGTRHESDSMAGVSHLLEHLVFKGTKTRSAFEIAKSLESLGGDLNAYTTREYTCYHAMVLKDDWKVAVEVLSDIVSNMKFSKEDFELEKSVVLQEIAMSEDEIDELIYDVFLEKHLGKNPLGRSILGTTKSITNMKMSQVYEYYEKFYCGSNIIVSVAGAIDHVDILAEVKRCLGKKKKFSVKAKVKKPEGREFLEVLERPVEQSHFLLGLPCSSFKDDFRFEAFIINSLLGGGMTSRLYQNIREKKGLVYTVYSSLNTFADFGMINVYAACEPKNMVSVVKSVMNELVKLKDRKVSRAEIEFFKKQTCGQLLLGADDMDNRMQSLAVNEMVFGKYKPVNDVVAEINKVSVESVAQFIDLYLHPDNLGIVLMGAQAEKIGAQLISKNII